MQPLYTASEIRALDRYTIEFVGIAEMELMERAAKGAERFLVRHFGEKLEQARGLILAGPGNNGGDALALARFLSERGCGDIQIILPLGEPKGESAQVQLKKVKELSLPISVGPGIADPDTFNFIVDGIFGVGLVREISDAMKDTFRKLNARTAGFVLALDIPSGLSADSGIVLGEAIRADATVTFGRIKRGLLTANAADYVGDLELVDIGLAESAPGVSPEVYWFEEEDAKAVLPKRKKSGHKGIYGHVHLWAGAEEKQGASILAALGALRSGAGLVTLVGDSSTIVSIRPRLIPEIMTQVVQGVGESAGEGQVLVIGPGMGTEEKSWAILKAALQSPAALVLDADALTLIAGHGEEAKKLLQSRAAKTVLTPHPKEAARLLQCGTSEVQQDRFLSVKKLQEQFHATILLKGKGTLVTDRSKKVLVVSRGDSGLSKGGTGDLLCGILATFLFQMESPAKAAALSAYVHGRASELCSQKQGTQRSSLASEIALEVPQVYRELES